MTSLNHRVAAGRGKVDRLEADIAAAYQRLLDVAAREAAKRFAARAPIRRSITAAVDPEWTPPDPSELVDTIQIALQANGKTRPLYERALRLMGEAAIGVGFAVGNPFAEQLIDQVAAKAAAIIGGYPDLLTDTIRDAYQQGLSVANAAKLIEARALDASGVTSQLLARTSLNAISNGSSLLAAQTVADAGGEGPRSKTWITAGDERVRDTHSEADGQTVPLDQPFDVGGEQLFYPGDPNGSLEETANCRCTLVYDAGVSAAAGRPPTDPLQSSGTVDTSPDDTSDAPPGIPAQLRDFHLTAAAGEPTRWSATLLVEGEPTEDGRMIADGATSWRGLPLPLGWMDTSGHGVPGPAPIIGRIDQIWKAGLIVQAAGVFNDVSDSFAAECVQKIGDGMVTGVSVDGVADWEIVLTRRDDTDQEEAEEIVESVGGEVVGDPYMDEDVDVLYVATTYTIMGATVCPAGAIARAQISIVAAGGEERAQILTPSQPTRCEVAPSPIDNGLSRSDVIAITHKSIDALAAAVATPSAAEPSSEHLETLAASVAAMQRELDEHRSELRAAMEAAEAADVGRERELRDTVASLQAEQRATFVQAGAVLEAIDQLTATVDDRFAALTAIDDKISRSLELAERKPRQVEVKRDDKGRMVGFVEG